MKHKAAPSGKKVADGLVGKRVKLADDPKKGWTVGIVRQTDKDPDGAWQINVIQQNGYERSYIITALKNEAGEWLVAGDRNPELQVTHLEELPDQNLEVQKTDAAEAYKRRYFACGCAEGKALLATKGLQALVKKNVCVWWEAEGLWYAGTVKAVVEDKLEMQVQYDDGEDEDVHLSRVWRLKKTNEKNPEAMRASVCTENILLPWSPEDRELLAGLKKEVLGEDAYVRFLRCSEGGSILLQACTSCEEPKQGGHGDGQHTSVHVQCRGDHGIVVQAKGKDAKTNRHIEHEFVFASLSTINSQKVQAEVDSSGYVQVLAPVASAEVAT